MFDSFVYVAVFSFLDQNCLLWLCYILCEFHNYCVNYAHLIHEIMLFVFYSSF